VQLTFENAASVSQNKMPDFLKCTFNDLQLFRGANGRLIEKENRTFVRTIPTQLTEAQKKTQAKLKKVARVIEIVFAANFVIS